MSREVQVRFCESRAVRFRPATHLVALCHSRQQAERVKATLARWLAPRGLVFNEDKTQIVHVEQTGFDSLGFTVRRYGGKLLIKPSATAVQRIRERLRGEIRALRGSNAAAILAALTPIIRGWAAYYRGMVSSKTFKSLDNYMWTLLYKWATRRHPHKPKTWVVDRYFGKYNKFRNDHWVFGDAASGAHLVKFSWTGIVRHTLVKGGASPDDPALAEYWARRRARIKPPVDGYTLRLLTTQAGRCPLCGAELLSPEQPPQSPQEWERWWLHVTRKAIVADYLRHHGRPGSPDGAHTRLVHTTCQREHLARRRRNPLINPESSSRLA
jgi:RNA-directed DNA polymerase